MPIPKRAPLSGDKLTDWIFWQFILLLKNKKLRIKKKKSVIKFIGRRKKSVRGISNTTAGPDSRGIEIIISSAKSVHANKNQELETLIHELAHILFPKTREKFIRQIEDVLVAKFTRNQKSLLKSFLLRHERKI